MTPRQLRRQKRQRYLEYQKKKAELDRFTSIFKKKENKITFMKQLENSKTFQRDLNNMKKLLLTPDPIVDFKPKKKQDDFFKL